MAERGTDRTAIWRLPAMQQLMVMTFLGFTSFFATLSALPSYASRNGVAVDVAGTVTTAMLVCTVVVQMLVPAMVNRFGTAAVLALGFVLLGAPSPLYLLRQDLWWLLTISAVRGAGFAVLTVLGATFTAKIAPPGRRGESIGLYGLAIAIPNLVALPLGVALVLAGKFVWVSWLALTPVLALPVVRPLARAAGGQSDPSERSKPSLAEVIGIGVPSVMLLIVTLAGGGLLTFLPIERPDGRLATIALAVFGIAAAVSRWGAGLLADRIGTGLLIPASLVASTIGLAAVAGGLVMGDSVKANAVVLVFALIFGAGYGAIQNLTLLEAFAHTEHHGTASAAWNVCFDGGTALGASAVGMVAAAGLGVPGAYLISAGLVMMTLPLVLALRPTRTF